MKSLTVLTVAILIIGLPRVAKGASTASGAVRGTVLDMANNPVTGATVSIRQVARAQPPSRNSVSTDAQGHFVVSNLGPGIYLVIVTKDPTGRENPHAFVALVSTFTAVAITPSTPTATMVLRLGKTTGFLTGHISDAATGSPVAAKINITDIRSGVTWMSAGIPPNFRIPIPSDAQLAIQISAAGYQPWNYSPAPGEPATTLTVYRAQKKPIQVTLQPVAVN
jgi:Carboxypeptidase regulatory-like domain